MWTPYLHLRSRKTDERRASVDQTGSDVTVNLSPPHNSVHWSCLRLCLCSRSSVQEEIRAVLQSVEISLPFLLTIWGQFVLWVASLRLSKLTMDDEGSTALGRERERTAAKSPNGVFIWGREPHTKTSHLKRRAWEWIHTSRNEISAESLQLLPVTETNLLQDICFTSVPTPASTGYKHGSFLHSSKLLWSSFYITTIPCIDSSKL